MEGWGSLNDATTTTKETRKQQQQGKPKQQREQIATTTTWYRCNSKKPSEYFDGDEIHPKRKIYRFL